MNLFEFLLCLVLGAGLAIWLARNAIRNPQRQLHVRLPRSKLRHLQPYEPSNTSSENPLKEASCD